ncbi:uncharacterized protein LOC125586233 [Brassica napus]|uniref:uncharacterized protein LOC125586233 n=1 Tax=Brassica napus TaxID=3708 RepID=UPI00207A41B9|nr:uncharacterized protein LOC125586233 [Brassica napus]
MWGEAVRHATYVINRVPTRALKDSTPYESLRGRKPSTAHIRVFGCVAHAKIDSHRLKKLDDRSQVLVHLGIEPGSKAYRLYNPTTKAIMGVDKEANTNSGMFSMTWGTTLDEGMVRLQMVTIREEPLTQSQIIKKKNQRLHMSKKSMKKQQLKNQDTQLDRETNQGLTGSNAAVVVAVTGVCGCGWLQFPAILRDFTTGSVVRN